MDKKVKFRTYEMIGSEIFKKEDFLSPKFKEGHDEIVVFENDKQYIHHKMALKNFTDIIIGEELVVPTLIGYANAKVISLNMKAVLKQEIIFICCLLMGIIDIVGHVMEC